MSKIDPTRNDFAVTIRMGKCHFDISRVLLKNAGMNLPIYVSEIQIPNIIEIYGPPACIMDLDSIILNKPTRKYPEIERRLYKMQQICTYLGITHVAWDREMSIEEWLHTYVLLPTS